MLKAAFDSFLVRGVKVGISTKLGSVISLAATGGYRSNMGTGGLGELLIIPDCQGQKH